MSLGSRFLQRGRVALSANLSSTPREPLLFLYPSWTRKSSTSAEAASTRDGGLPIRSSQPNIARQPVLSNPASANDDEASLQLRLDNPESDPPSSGTQATTTTIKAIISAKDNLPRKLSEEPIVQKDDSVVKRQVRRMLQTEENARKSEVVDRKMRNAYYHWRREVSRSWVPDWRVILADLNKHTPQHGKWLDQALELVIPIESLPQLVHGIDDFILDIGHQHGVSIRLGELDDDTKQVRRFIISGPATAISKTTADVLRIAPTTEMKTASSLSPPQTDDVALEGTLEKETSLDAPSNEQEFDVRYIFTDVETQRLKMPPEQIPRPETWTHVSFLDYVRALIASSVSNHLNRFGFQSPQDHVTAITQILRDLFKDPNCAGAISRTACNEAMQFFVKANRIEDVRALFVLMDMLKLPTVPETFNIMLRGAAKNEDLHNFHFILHLMLRRGVVPNGMTWIAFMKAHPDVRVKLHILTAMKAKGLTAHPSMMKEVCHELVQPEIESSLEQNLSQAQFVAHMDSRYGPDWLSLDNANRALHSLGARGLISRCWEFLNFMSSRFIEHDNYSINTILHHCKQQTNLTGAVELLRSLPIRDPSRGTFGFVPDEETYRIMFELAWRSRSYNLARVTWRYACLSAETTRMMRVRVFTSMLYASSKDTRATPRERWKQFAGPVIFGANHHGEHPAQILAEMYPGESAATSVSAFGQTNLGDNKDFKGLSQAVDDEVIETARKEPPYKEESEVETSENGRSGLEDTTIADSQSDERELGSAETAGTTSTSGDFQVAGQDWVTQRLEKFAPIGILDLEESMDQTQTQLWFQTKEKLKLKLLQDLEIYKRWQPVRPFTEMLVEALELDTQWRESGKYVELDMETLIQDGIRVWIYTKGTKIQYKWK